MTDAPHLNPAFDREMKTMDRLLDEMESALQRQFQDLAAAFATMDLTTAAAVEKNDETLNALDAKVEEQSITILAKRQPVAEDLRRVVGAIRTALEYERMGDYVKNVAKNTASFITHRERLEIFPALSEMIAEARKMFDCFLRAQKTADITAAKEVWRHDAVLDDMYLRAVDAAIGNQRRGDGNTRSLVHVVTIAHNLERIGDRIQNLVEIFYYRKTGEILDDKGR